MDDGGGDDDDAYEGEADYEMDGIIQVWMAIDCYLLSLY
jgi:hypothetical protein